MSRKYQETSGYWVYVHTTPNGMYYIGMSKQQPWQRWNKSLYKDNSLATYIEQYGWENITHKVIIDGLTKEQAEAWEDRLIQALSMNGLCINRKRSGGIERDNKKGYKRQWKEDHKDYDKRYYEDNKEEIKVHMKQRYSTPEGKIYTRVSAYNQYHKNEVIETPMEAKQKYLQWGYIPTYIKHDDL